MQDAQPGPLDGTLWRLVESRAWNAAGQPQARAGITIKADPADIEAVSPRCPAWSPRPAAGRCGFSACLPPNATPEMRRFLAAEGATPTKMGADEFQRLIEAETARFAEVMRAAGISAP